MKGKTSRAMITNKNNLKLFTSYNGQLALEETKLIAAPIEQKLTTGPVDPNSSLLTGADLVVPSNDWAPVKVYVNADIHRLEIFNDNRGKCGVYCWVNKLNGKLYVGSAKDLTRRLYQYYSHKHMEICLGKGKSHIYSSILKNGYSAFEFHILEYTEPSDLIVREQYYIDLFNPEYNINQTAYSRLGRMHSEESKDRIRAAKLGQNSSEETKDKIRAANLGKKLSEETKDKIRTAAKNLSEEIKARMSAANLGKKLSEETKDKIRAANLGKKLSEETKAKIRAARLEKLSETKAREYTHSEETRAKMRGRTVSEEIRIKISKNSALSKPVIVTDVETGKVEEYSSIKEAANALNCSREGIYSYLKKAASGSLLFKGIYKIEKVTRAN